MVLDRHVLLAFAAYLVVILLWNRAAVSGLLELKSPAALVDFLSGGASEFLVIAALFAVIHRIGDDVVLSAVDLCTLALASLCFILPSLRVACIPITIVAAVLLRRSDRRLSSIGQLLLAIASYELLGRIVFWLVAPFVLSAETTAVSALLSWFGQFSRDGLVITSADAHSIVIETPCSAFHNLTMAVIIWISLTKLERLEFTTTDYWRLAAMVSATVVLNTVRIALMAQSYEMYVYWHHGAGETIASFAILGSLLAIAFAPGAASRRA
jgi:hypothetical protein